MPKSRDGNNPSKISRPKISADLKDKQCIIFDDMIDTGGTIVSASESLKSAGAKSVIVCATHAIFSGPAITRIQQSKIDYLIVTDSVPQHEHQKSLGKKLKVIPTSSLLADTIKSIYGDRNLVDID